MLKKISNWTFGSIFRTIGRFIAYIIIGVLISLLFIKKDYVKASEQVTKWAVMYTNPERTTQGTSVTLNSNTNLNFTTTKFYWPENNTNAYQYQGGYVIIPFTITAPILEKSDYNTIYGSDWCYRWECETLNTATNTCSKYKCTYLQSSTNSGVTENEYITPTISVKGKLYTKHNNISYNVSCLVENNSFKCPINYGVDYMDYIQIESNVYYNSSTTKQYKLEITNFVIIEYDTSQNIINNQNQNHQQQMDYFNSTISGEVNGTGENGTITDEDAESASCGIICKLKHLIKMLSIDNIKYLVIPTEEQMNDLFEQMQTKVTSKLGILGLPITVYTRLMQIAMQYDDNQQNWCLQWNNVQVPNFEDFNIIEGGQWCFSDILQNEKINTFRTVCITIIGGLILLSFIQYLFNCLHRILDVPIQDNYEYFTVEDVTTMDPVTGEVRGTQHKERRTRKLEVND